MNTCPVTEILGNSLLLKFGLGQKPPEFLMAVLLSQRAISEDIPYTPLLTPNLIPAKSLRLTLLKLPHLNMTVALPRALIHRAQVVMAE